MLKTLLLTAAVVLATTPVLADTVRLVVPYSAGGPMDQIARIIAPALQTTLGATVVVENVPGAGGLIGMGTVAKATPDGKTLVITGQGHVLSSLTQKANLTFDPLKSFTQIALVGKMPAMLVAGKHLGVKRLPELIALAKTKTLHYGSSGVGNSPHLAGEMINEQAGVKMVHVPYAGVGPVVADIVAGNVDIVVADLPVVVPFVKSGDLIAISNFGDERTDVLPDVPTSGEQGYPNLITGNYYYIFGPTGMTDETRTKVETAVLTALKQPATAERLTAAGVKDPANGVALLTLLESEFRKWEPMVERLGLSGG